MQTDTMYYIYAIPGNYDVHIEWAGSLQYKKLESLELPSNHISFHPYMSRVHKSLLIRMSLIVLETAPSATGFCILVDLLTFPT
jgi:hypothetical protein